MAKEKTRDEVMQLVRELVKAGIMKDDHPLVKDFLSKQKEEIPDFGIKPLDDCGIWKSYIVCH